MIIALEWCETCGVVYSVTSIVDNEEERRKEMEGKGREEKRRKRKGGEETTKPKEHGVLIP